MLFSKEKIRKYCKLLCFLGTCFALKFGNSGNISYIYSMNEMPKAYGSVHKIPV